MWINGWFRLNKRENEMFLFFTVLELRLVAFTRASESYAAILVVKMYTRNLTPQMAGSVPHHTLGIILNSKTMLLSG